MSGELRNLSRYRCGQKTSIFWNLKSAKEHASGKFQYRLCSLQRSKDQECWTSITNKLASMHTARFPLNCGDFAVSGGSQHFRFFNATLQVITMNTEIPASGSSWRPGLLITWERIRSGHSHMLQI